MSKELKAADMKAMDVRGREVMAANQTVPLDMIALADAGGSAAATGKFVIGGSWSLAGTPAVSQ